MTVRQTIIFSVAALALFTLLLFIVFGDQGLADYNVMRMEKTLLIKKNEQLNKENQALYREVDRLENDLEFIENEARHELGMIGKDEWIFKMTTDGAAKDD